MAPLPARPHFLATGPAFPLENRFSILCLPVVQGACPTRSSAPPACGMGSGVGTRCELAGGTPAATSGKESHSPRQSQEAAKEGQRESVAGRSNSVDKKQEQDSPGGEERNSGCRNRSQSAETQNAENIGQRKLVTCTDGGVLGSREMNTEVCVKSQGQT